jgi:N-glycosidase YbiA
MCTPLDSIESKKGKSSMKPQLKSYGKLETIYYPAKKSLRVLPGGELLKRQQLFLLREVLSGKAQERVYESLLVRETAGKVILDWGSNHIVISEKRILQEIKVFLDTLIFGELQTIYFYKVEETPYGCFSNCAPYGVWLDGRWWSTTEHYFQAQKFLFHPKLQDLMGSIASAKEVARRGREFHSFLRHDWEQVKVDVMREAVWCKFKTHASLRQILLDTAEMDIVEDAPHDYFWGCGEDGYGKNMLGQILVEVRGRLRRENASDEDSPKP